MNGIETIMVNEPSQAERTTTTNLSLIHGNDNDYRHLTPSQKEQLLQTSHSFLENDN